VTDDDISTREDDNTKTRHGLRLVVTRRDEKPGIHRCRRYEDTLVEPDEE